MRPDLIPKIEALGERLTAWCGSPVEILERISRLPGTLDRHFTTSSRFVMRLEFVGFAISGGSFTLTGTTEGRFASYQAACDRIDKIHVGPDEASFVEVLGSSIERHSVVRLVDEEAA